MAGMTSRNTALVTGANRGLGLEVCRRLALLDHQVVLTARDPAHGAEAASRLRMEIDSVPAEVDDPVVQDVDFSQIPVLIVTLSGCAETSDFEDYERLHPERYEARSGPLRSVVRASVHAFLDCGRPQGGFAIGMSNTFGDAGRPDM